MLEAFRICKNIAFIPSGTHATPILVIFGTSCTVLATVPNRIRNFDFFFSECIPWTHTQLWYPKHGARTTRWITRRLTKLSHFKF